MGVIINRNGSMPSGTTFTNTLDSIVNLIGALYVSLKLNKELKVIEIQGDDAVYILSGLAEEQFDQVAAAYADLG
jgi:hypothetical protein